MSRKATLASVLVLATVVYLLVADVAGEPVEVTLDDVDEA